VRAIPYGSHADYIKQTVYMAEPGENRRNNDTFNTRSSI
jgi:hypothetical protein